MKKLLLISLVILTLFGGKKLYFDVYDSDNVRVESNIKYHIITFKEGSTDFSVSKEKNDDYNFYVNSNFFTSEGTPIGGVVVNNKTINRQLNKGGSFIVGIDNTPNITFNKVRKVKHLSQTHIWALKGGEINEKVLTQNHAKKKVNRLLIGKNKKGEITVIHSNLLVLVTMEDIIKTAKEYGLVDAIILDSGPSIDIKVNQGLYTHRMETIPFFLQDYFGYPKPVVYIGGNFI
jgi:hypothetical protein